MKSLLGNSHGIALAAVIFVVTVLLTLTGAGLLFSGLDLKMTNAHQTETKTLEVADAAIQHALSVIPAGMNFSYSTDSSNPSCVIPSSSCSTTTFDFGGGYSYTVTAVNTAGGTQAILTATAFGPNSTKKVVVAYIGRGGYGLGATSLPGSTAPDTQTNFSGTSFSINGNDHCNAAPTIPGIVVTDPALATAITNNTTSDGGLAANQMNLVTGAGGAPSVATIAPLSQTVSQIADSYLNLTVPGHTDLPGGNYSSNDTWGTSTLPKITHITSDAKIEGTITGYGVLIVDGELEIQGNFTFNGLVIARGGDVAVEVTGNAGIYGSLLIAPKSTQDASYELDVRGNAHVQFDSCALSPVDNWVPLPKKAKLLAWQEKLMN